MVRLFPLISLADSYLVSLALCFVGGFDVAGSVLWFVSSSWRFLNSAQGATAATTGADVRDTTSDKDYPCQATSELATFGAVLAATWDLQVGEGV